MKSIKALKSDWERSRVGFCLSPALPPHRGIWSVRDFSHRDRNHRDFHAGQPAGAIMMSEDFWHGSRQGCPYLQSGCDDFWIMMDT